VCLSYHQAIGDETTRYTVSRTNYERPLSTRGVVYAVGRLTIRRISVVAGLQVTGRPRPDAVDLQAEGASSAIGWS
jgi:hypothetical protein